MSQTVAQQVASQIEEAFSTTPYPGDDAIGWDGIEDTLRGKHWRELSLDDIFRERGELSFLTPAAFQFYLPAFMLGVINHYSEVDTLSRNLIVFLCPNQNIVSPNPDKHAPTDRIKRRIAEFSQDETLAVCAFLKSYRLIHAEEFDESTYRILLDSAVQFWEAKVKDNLTYG